MIVFKFGGKSLGNKEKICKIANYIKSRCKNEKIIVVVSAMADTTDKIIEIAKEYSQNPSTRELDTFLSCGETISASLLAIKLCSIGVKACSMLGWQAKILAEGNFGDGIIKSIDKEAIETKMKIFDCVVVAGFQAQNSNDDIITLGRGGSDTTAVALGAVFDCPVEIYSDFNGIYAGDPRSNKFKKYNKVDYETALKYAETGAKVLCNTSVDIAKKFEVKVICKSSEKPKLKGTALTKTPTPFVGINVKNEICKIDIVFNKNNEKLLKTIKFLLKKIKFYEILIKNQTISIILDYKFKEEIEREIIRINKLSQ